MTDKQMRKMSRQELLVLLLEQMEENDRLKKEIDDLKAELTDRQIKIENAGSMAEAALKLNRVFEAADEAAKQYLESVRAMTGERKKNDEVPVNKKKKKRRK